MTEEALELARKRGEYVHYACQLMDNMELEWRTLDEDLKPYVTAWAQFMSDRKATVLELEDIRCIELEVYSKSFNYVGHLDRMLIMAGQWWLIDIKTGQPEPTAALQTAAYEHAFREMLNIHGGRKIRRGSVQLSPDEKYRLKEYNDHHDLHNFIAKLRSTQWDLRHGYLP